MLLLLLLLLLCEVTTISSKRYIQWFRFLTKLNTSALVSLVRHAIYVSLHCYIRNVDCLCVAHTGKPNKN